MEIGIFAKTFGRTTPAETFGAVRAAGLRHVQFNMLCAGLSEMPDEIGADVIQAIRVESARHEVAVAALSGTYNMIHPDMQQREAGRRRLRVMARASRELGTPVVTLCTGTRDPDYLWAAHPENASPEAWADMVEEMAGAAAMAEEEDVVLAFETEVSNVVDSAPKAWLLLDEVASSRLKVVLDGANLYPAGSLHRMTEILEEAFDLLGDDIVLAHAKDLDRDGEAGHEAAGTGLLDYDLFISLLAAAGYSGPLVLHSLTEAQVPNCVAFLRGKLVAAALGPS